MSFRASGLFAKAIEGLRGNPAALQLLQAVQAESDLVMKQLLQPGAPQPDFIRGYAAALANLLEVASEVWNGRPASTPTPVPKRGAAYSLDAPEG